jgi:hypothetical protein
MLTIFVLTLDASYQFLRFVVRSRLRQVLIAIGRANLANLHGAEARKAYHLDGLHTGFSCRQPKKNVTLHMVGCLCHNIDLVSVRHTRHLLGQ